MCEVFDSNEEARAAIAGLTIDLSALDLSDGDQSVVDAVLSEVEAAQRVLEALVVRIEARWVALGFDPEDLEPER